MAPALLVQSFPTHSGEGFFSLSSPVKTSTRKRATSKTACTQPKPEVKQPRVSKLDLNSYKSQDDLVVDIIESLRRSGGCIIRNMIQKPVLSSIESEIRPHLDQIQKADCMYNQSIY